LLTAGPAIAQPTAEQQSALRSNCRSDFMSNCSGVKTGGIEALQCLQRNVAKLSPGCQSAVNALAPRSAPPQATAAPAPTATPPAASTPAVAAAPAVRPSAQPAAAPITTPAAAPRAPQPVRAATAQPSAAPTAAAIARPSAQQQATIRQSCQSDFMARCSGVQPGGAEALRCLQRNSAQLSPNCKTALAALGGSAPVTAAAAEPAPAARLGPPGPVGPLRRALRERMLNR
jgi:hypothetical protein